MTAGRHLRASLAFFVTSTVLFVAAFEVLARLFVRPSPNAYGTLLGRELPPVRVIPVRLPDPGSAKSGGRVDGDAVGWPDLQGILREDPLLGYAPQEGTTSPHGWWTTNNIGARSATDTAAQPLPGRHRILVFGESFASGSRVRQADAWTSVLAAGRADVEVVNLAVDGYGVGQSFLRFQQATRTLDYQTALLVVVPSADLWREVNTIRALAQPSWNSYTVMPRFTAEDGRLTLVPSPYAIGSDVYADNAFGLSETLRRHLSRYDRFYFRARYESSGVIGHLLLYKIGAAVYSSIRASLLYRSMGAGHIALDSEAMQLTRMIVDAMRDAARTSGKRFVLAIMPEHAELRRIRRSPRSAQNWHDVFARLCAPTIDCIDVAPALQAAPAEDLDWGHDGSHFGPRANRVIAATMGDGLRRLGVL